MRHRKASALSKQKTACGQKETHRTRTNKHKKSPFPDLPAKKGDCCKKDGKAQKRLSL